MDSDRSDIADYRGDYTSVVATELTDRPRLIKRHPKAITLALLGYMILAIVAVALSALSLRNDASQSDKLLVSACEQTNVSRKNVYESFITLAILSVETQQNRQASPLVTRYVDYLNEAFEPLSCDLDDPAFGIDTTPPDSLAVNEYFPGGPYSARQQ